MNKIEVNNSGKYSKLLRLLRENSRIKLTDLSVKSGIPLTTTFTNLERLERQGIRYTTLVDFKRFGFFSRNKLVITVDKQHRDALEQHLLNSGNVNNMYVINNGFDFLIETIFPSKTESRSFVDELRSLFNISQIHVFEIVSDKKREEFKLL